MEKVYKEKNGLYKLDTDEGHIIHKIGTDDYQEIRHLMTKHPEEWEEIAVEDIPPYTQEEYKKKVEELIRMKYTASDEFAIQRKMLNTMLPQTATLADDEEVQSNPEKAIEEYYEYNTYVEQCKSDAPQAIAEDKEREQQEESSIEE